MKAVNVLVGMLVAAVFAVGAVARAEVPPEWKDCEKEIAKYCPKAKTDKDILACIDKREKMGAKKSGLSPECNAAHEKMEPAGHEAGETKTK